MSQCRRKKRIGRGKNPKFSSLSLVVQVIASDNTTLAFLPSSIFCLCYYSDSFHWQLVGTGRQEFLLAKLLGHYYLSGFVLFIYFYLNPAFSPRVFFFINVPPVLLTGIYFLQKVCNLPWIVCRLKVLSGWKRKWVRELERERTVSK